MTTPTRRWARTDATQLRILDAATEVFSARGFSAATMADIVEHSGASIGSIYHHFGGKKELFLATSSAWPPTSTGTSKPPRIRRAKSTANSR